MFRERLAHSMLGRMSFRPFICLKLESNVLFPLISSSFLPSALDDFFIAFREKKKTKNKQYYLNAIHALVKEQDC